MALGDVEDGGAEEMNDLLRLGSARWRSRLRRIRLGRFFLLVGILELLRLLAEEFLESRAGSAVLRSPVGSGKPMKQSAPENHNAFPISGSVASGDEPVGEIASNDDRILPIGREAATLVARRDVGDRHPRIVARRQRPHEVGVASAT